MTSLRVVGAGVVAAAGWRLARSRRRRSLHPAGRSLRGELEVWGCVDPVGSRLLDRPGRHPVTVRVSKGVGTRGDRLDVRGIAIRVGDCDLLLSTIGPGRWGRHVPMPRRTFDARYGTITAYRSRHGKLHLAAIPDPVGAPLGGDLDAVVAAAGQGRAGFLLYAIRGGGIQPFGRVTLGPALPAEIDAALAFDPVRNSADDLHPTGRLHGLRAFAYRASQRWRGVSPAPANPRAVARTVSGS